MHKPAFQVILRSPVRGALRPFGFACGIALLGSCVWAAPCVVHSLPGFAVCVPSSWVRKSAGVDSSAGQFVSPGLVVTYDLGLYADPLRVPHGASDVQEIDAVVDGRPGRQVSYRVKSEGQPSMHYAGVHVPLLGATSMGPLRFTMLGRAADPTRLMEVSAATATVRFKSAGHP
ncbi:MAG: hypothetical protein JWQ41_3285 [Variovorax sp.]|nr:hypothetical protein [Variovorax sp.]